MEHELWLGVAADVGLQGGMSCDTGGRLCDHGVTWSDMAHCSMLQHGLRSRLAALVRCGMPSASLSQQACGFGTCPAPKNRNVWRISGGTPGTRRAPRMAASATAAVHSMSSLKVVTPAGTIA
eukprot:360103-Chlamydomonas_euryale.AAC.6